MIIIALFIAPQKFVEQVCTVHTVHNTPALRVKCTYIILQRDILYIHSR